MTSTVTETTITTITSLSYDALSTTFGLIAIILLTTLILQKEIMRARGGARANLWLKTLDTAIIPLLVVFGLVIIMRLVNLL